MNQRSLNKGELIIGGSGGQGVLTVGKMLAEAATASYEQVVWAPLYGHQMRGGPSECTVIFSNEPIHSPILSRVQAAIISDPTPVMVGLIKNKVVPGGWLLLEAAGNIEIDRKDIKLLRIPATEIAAGLGDSRASLLILMGIYIGLTGMVPPDAIDIELEKKFGSKPKVLAINRSAFRRGLEMSKDLVNV
jgi:2-oxoglutarate ferredoxin oxidoreductase subunit gamma